MTLPCFCPIFVLASGLQAILPEYLRARFVQAALSYIGCNEEGQFACRDNDCWCQCAVDYPQCNCPEVDLRAMEASLLQIRDSWNMANQDFEESGQCFPFNTHSMDATLPLTANYTLLFRSRWPEKTKTERQRKQETITSNPCNGNTSVHRGVILKQHLAKLLENNTEGHLIPIN